MKRTFDVAYPVGAEDQYVHKANADMSSSAHSPATIATDVDESDLPKAAKGWVAHREPTSYEMQPVPTVKAYKNSTFLNSPHVRHTTYPTHNTSCNPPSHLTRVGTPCAFA